jgi:hypothetical protein
MCYPPGRYFRFWALEDDDDGRMDWDGVGCLEENMPPRHKLLARPCPSYWHPRISMLRRMGGGCCSAGFMISSAQIVILGSRISLWMMVGVGIAGVCASM